MSRSPSYRARKLFLPPPAEELPVVPLVDFPAAAVPAEASASAHFGTLLAPACSSPEPLQSSLPEAPTGRKGTRRLLRAAAVTVAEAVGKRTQRSLYAYRGLLRANGILGVERAIAESPSMPLFSLFDPECPLSLDGDHHHEGEGGSSEAHEVAGPSILDVVIPPLQSPSLVEASYAVPAASDVAEAAGALQSRCDAFALSVERQWRETMSNVSAAFGAPAASAATEGLCLMLVEAPVFVSSASSLGATTQKDEGEGEFASPDFSSLEPPATRPLEYDLLWEVAAPSACGKAPLFVGSLASMPLEMPAEIKELLFDAPQALFRPDRLSLALPVMPVVEDARSGRTSEAPKAAPLDHLPMVEPPVLFLLSSSSSSLISGGGVALNALGSRQLPWPSLVDGGIRRDDDAWGGLNDLPQDLYGIPFLQHHGLSLPLLGRLREVPVIDFLFSTASASSKACLLLDDESPIFPQFKGQPLVGAVAPGVSNILLPHMLPNSIALPSVNLAPVRFAGAWRRGIAASMASSTRATFSTGEASDAAFSFAESIAVPLPPYSLGSLSPQPQATTAVFLPADVAAADDAEGLRVDGEALLPDATSAADPRCWFAPLPPGGQFVPFSSPSLSSLRPKDDVREVDGPDALDLAALEGGEAEVNSTISVEDGGALLVREEARDEIDLTAEEADSHATMGLVRRLVAMANAITLTLESSGLLPRIGAHPAPPPPPSAAPGPCDAASSLHASFQAGAPYLPGHSEESIRGAVQALRKQVRSASSSALDVDSSRGGGAGGGAASSKKRSRESSSATAQHRDHSSSTPPSTNAVEATSLLLAGAVFLHAVTGLFHKPSSHERADYLNRIIDNASYREASGAYFPLLQALRQCTVAEGGGGGGVEALCGRAVAACEALGQDGAGGAQGGRPSAAAVGFSPAQQPPPLPLTSVPSKKQRPSRDSPPADNDIASNALRAVHNSSSSSSGSSHAGGGGGASSAAVPLPLLEAASSSSPPEVLLTCSEALAALSPGGALASAPIPVIIGDSLLFDLDFRRCLDGPSAVPLVERELPKSLDMLIGDTVGLALFCCSQEHSPPLGAGRGPSSSSSKASGGGGGGGGGGAPPSSGPPLHYNPRRSGPQTVAEAKDWVRSLSAIAGSLTDLIILVRQSPLRLSADAAPGPARGGAGGGSGRALAAAPPSPPPPEGTGVWESVVLPTLLPALLVLPLRLHLLVAHSDEEAANIVRAEAAREVVRTLFDAAAASEAMAGAAQQSSSSFSAGGGSGGGGGGTLRVTTSALIAAAERPFLTESPSPVEELLCGDASWGGDSCSVFLAQRIPHLFGSLACFIVAPLDAKLALLAPYAPGDTVAYLHGLLTADVCVMRGEPILDAQMEAIAKEVGRLVAESLR